MKQPTNKKERINIRLRILRDNIEDLFKVFLFESFDKKRKEMLEKEIQSYIGRANSHLFRSQKVYIKLDPQDNMPSILLKTEPHNRGINLMDILKEILK